MILGDLFFDFYDIDDNDNELIILLHQSVDKVIYKYKVMFAKPAFDLGLTNPNNLCCNMDCY